MAVISSLASQVLAPPRGGPYHSLLLTTHYLSLTTYYLLLTSYYLLLATAGGRAARGG